METRHTFDADRRTAPLPRGVEGLDQCDQRRLGDHLIHLGQEDFVTRLARFGLDAYSQKV